MNRNDALDWIEHEQWILHIQYVWLPAIMHDQLRALPSRELLEWEEARARAEARYPTKQQWLALKPSPGQSYQPFSFPHPRPSE